MNISTSSWVLRSVICWMGSVVLEKLEKNIILPQNAGNCSPKYHDVIVKNTIIGVNASFPCLHGVAPAYFWHSCN